MAKPTSSLCDEFKVILAEALSRAGPHSSVYVNAGNLGALAKAHSRLT